MSSEQESLIGAARHFYQRGWMVGTAGNLSVRAAAGGFWITASGRHKGELLSQDFIRLDQDGALLERFNERDQPSAEASIHRAIYRSIPDVGAVFHVHSVEANLAGHWAEAGELNLPPLEMLKGLGVWDENPAVALPVFDNLASVPRIAELIEKRFLARPPAVPALLIHRHGATVWGPDLKSALHHTEIMEYIFRYLVMARAVGIRGNA